MDFSERAQHFDHYTQSVHEALSHPEVEYQLAESGLGHVPELVLDANSRTFLPNQTDSGFYVPDEHAGDFTVPALIPVSYEEAWHVGELIAPITSEFGEWQELPPTLTSPMSGASEETHYAVGRRLEMDRTRETAGQEKTPPVGLDPWTAARTFVSYRLRGNEAGGVEISASRPVIAVRAEVLEGLDAMNTAATIGHEAVHGVDAAACPTMFDIPTLGGDASELVGNKVSDVLYGMTDQPLPPGIEMDQVARRFEAWRQRTLGPTGYVLSFDDSYWLQREFYRPW